MVFGKNESGWGLALLIDSGKKSVNLEVLHEDVR